MELRRELHVPVILTLVERNAPFTYWGKCFMGSIACLNAAKSKKIYCPRQESNSYFIAVQAVTRRYTD
jgi:hypothetical protein